MKQTSHTLDHLTKASNMERARLWDAKYKPDRGGILCPLCGELLFSATAMRDAKCYVTQDGTKYLACPCPEVCAANAKIKAQYFVDSLLKARLKGGN